MQVKGHIHSLISVCPPLIISHCFPDSRSSSCQKPAEGELVLHWRLTGNKRKNQFTMGSCYRCLMWVSVYSLVLPTSTQLFLIHSVISYFSQNYLLNRKAISTAMQELIQDFVVLVCCFVSRHLCTVYYPLTVAPVLCRQEEFMSWWLLLWQAGRFFSQWQMESVYSTMILSIQVRG